MQTHLKQNESHFIILTLFDINKESINVGLIRNKVILKYLTLKTIMEILYAPLTLLSLPFIAEKKFTNKADLVNLIIGKPKSQNRCGTLFTLGEKVDVATTDYVVDYHTHLGENNKMVLCLASS